MSRGVNRWHGIGNLCADPDVRHTANGSAVTNIRIACNDSYTDKITGQKVDRAEYIGVVFFNKLAEIAGQYLKKGAKVYVEGSLRTRQWEKDGQKHYTTEIVANEMQMMDSRGDTGQPEQRRANTGDGGKAYREASGGRAAPAAPTTSFDDFDDDGPIPF